MQAFEDKFSEVAALIGDKARSVMLWCLLDGRAYTATELAICANISAQSASNHLSKLIQANIVVVEKQGRHRYYRCAGSHVAQAIESLAGLVNVDQNKRIAAAPPDEITHARTCYDHLAGKVGVAVTHAMLDKKIIRPREKNKYEVTATGEKWFASFNIDIGELKNMKRSFAHPCLDWSERKHHVAGALGSALLTMMLEKDWIRKKRNTRALLITPKGQIAFREKLAIEI
jgi:DNA-binding transcriptional ArsR family regulator